jgi:hypothetical protein
MYIKKSVVRQKVAQMIPNGVLFTFHSSKQAFKRRRKTARKFDTPAAARLSEMMVSSLASASLLACWGIGDSETVKIASKSKAFPNSKKRENSSIHRRPPSSSSRKKKIEFRPLSLSLFFFLLVSNEFKKEHSKSNAKILCSNFPSLFQNFIHCPKFKRLTILLPFAQFIFYISLLIIAIYVYMLRPKCEIVQCAHWTSKVRNKIINNNIFIKKISEKNTPKI